MIIASFDVFETVLVRAVGSPSAVFLLLGRRLKDLSLMECTAEAFARAREAAEHRAYKNVGIANTTLVHIYAELSHSLWLDSDVCDQIMRMECELEAELLRVVPEIQHLVLEARARGEKVVFLSDMYLPDHFIESQLVRHGAFQTGDHCYVSSAHRKMKSAGDLFRKLLEDEGVPAELVLHHGNQPDHDVRPAREVGLKVHEFYEGNLNRYEDILESYSSMTDGLSSVMAGASRLARLSVRVSDQREQALRDVAAGVAAPALVGFMLWVLQRAKQAGLKRLYFISRDGQILLEIARRLAGKLDVSCELRYLYGSRQSWNLSGIRGSGDIDGSWILDETDSLTVESLLSRVCIRPDEVREALVKRGFGEESWTRNLDQKERRVLAGLLEEDEMRSLILEKATETRAVFIKYLRQESVFDAVDWALVDVGWGGSLQKSLASVLSDVRDTPPAAFYFGLEDRPTHGGFGTCETYFYDVKLERGFLQAARSQWVPVIEMFCTADHGTVVRFVEEAGSVQPELKEVRNAMALQWGLDVVQRTMCSFAENLLLDGSVISLKADIREAIQKLLETFWLNPTPHEAVAWGGFPWEDGFGTHSYVARLAESFDWGDVARTLSNGGLEEPRRPSWPAGSFALTPRHIQRFLKGAVFVGRRRSKAIETCWRRIRGYESRNALLVGRVLRVIVFLIRPGLFERLRKACRFGSTVPNSRDR